MRLLIALLISLATSIPYRARADVLCVRPGGGAPCFATIAGALTAAAAGDTIRVAAGTYVGAITLNKNVTLEGGWNTAFSTRDPATQISSIVAGVGDTSSVVSHLGSIAAPASSSPVIDGFTIEGGRADLGSNHGGGVRLRYSQATLRACVIRGNRGYLLGGGVWVQGGQVRFERVRIEGNVVTDAGMGGGVMLEGASATFEDSLIQGNSIEGVGGSGGGIAIQHGASAPASLVIRRSTIADNSAGPSCQGSGGGIYVQVADTRQVDAVLDRVRFSKNCGQFMGGAIGIDSTGSASYTVANSVFSANNGGGNGDEIHVATSSVTAVLRNVTLVGRSGADRGITTGGSLTLVNSIIRGFATGVDYFGAAAQLSVTFNSFSGNVTDLKVNNAATVPGATNLLVVDPLLDASQHLQAGSPAIDAGTRTVGPFRDVDGGPRPSAGPSGRFRLDIGADEFPFPDAQLVYDEAGDPVDLAVVGPGDPPEDPNDTTTTNEFIGYSALGADFTGDGRDDLLVAAEDWSNDFDDPANASPGRLFGLFNFGARRSGVRDLLLDAPEDLTVRGELVRQHMGSELASGDVNGDGRRDLVIGSFEDDDVGNVLPKVFVLFGGSALAGVRPVSSGIPADFTLIAPDFDYQAFSAPNALVSGDLDGGGVADIAVGDALADDDTSANAGAVFVIFGRNNLSGSRDLASASADFTLYGPSANAGLGSSSNDAIAGTAIGDLNGDGALDLVARSPTTAYVLFGPLAPGVRRLASAPADVTITGLTDGAVIAADVTGDGRLDLVLGAEGALRVIPGPFLAGQTLASASAAVLVLTGAGANARALALGDVLGDARPDLIVASSVDPVFGGQVYVVSPGVKATGSVPIDEIASAAVVESSGRARFFAWAVAAGDFDSDGRKDLVVTDRFASSYADHGFPDANDAGRAYVIYGGDPADNCPGLANSAQADGDADGAGDACDNCPFYPSASFADTDADGRGDACECTDQNGDGRNTVSDLVAINTAIFNPGLVTPLCDGNNDGGCNVNDIIAANIEIFSPTNTSSCARQPVPGP